MTASNAPTCSPPAADGPAPLDRLARCPDRLARQLKALHGLAPRISACGVDAQAMQAAREVLRYFDEAAPQHHADEEEDLFPALIESMAGSDAVCLRELTQALAGEHRVQEAAWRQLRPPLERIAAGLEAPLDAGVIEAFITQHRQHVEREDSELLPMAARLLTDADLARIDRAMQSRRERAQDQAGG